MDPASSLEPVIVDRPGSRHALRSFGHVEALRIRRRSRKRPELLLFKGAPASKHSMVKSVLVTISDVPPAPWMDKEKGRIHLSYPTLGDSELQALLADPGAFMCYFWASSDGAKSLAWLLKTR